MGEIGIVRALWRGRAPSPDLPRYPTDSGWRNKGRVLVPNHGPAVMRKVEVQVKDVDVQSLAVAESDLTAPWPKTPVEKLHIGQSLYLTLNQSR